MAKKILLVEDEKSIAEGIIYNLKNEGMRVTHCLLYTSPSPRDS